MIGLHTCHSEAFEVGGWDAVTSVVLSRNGTTVTTCDDCARRYPERVRQIDHDGDGDGLALITDLAEYRRHRRQR